MDNNKEDMSKKLICIICPKGCNLSFTIDSNNLLSSISGNECKRGEIFVKNELINPMRIVTSTVRVESGEIPLCPVKTSKSIPKRMIFDCIREISYHIIAAPVTVGEVVIKNVGGLGVDVLATRNILKKIKT